MARPRKKLQKSDINRNTSIEVSHTIKKIKENERKYTVILVIIFMSVFALVGYKVFSINSDVLFENVSASSYDNYFSASLEKIVLTNKDIYSDEDGLKTNKHVINIVNNTNVDKKYKIYFKRDGLDSIKYSFNQKDILKLGEDNLFTEGSVGKGETISLTYNIWIDNQNIDLNKEYQIKGYFIVKEIES